jgi:hypothetical protein
VWYRAGGHGADAGSQTLSPAATPDRARSRSPTGRCTSTSTRTRAPTPRSRNFASDTGIAVTYAEAINDNEEFFGRIQPDLAAGRYDRLRHHRA